MDRDQVEAIVEALVVKFEHDDNPPIERLDEAARRIPSPERTDWAALEAKFGRSFEPSFMHFMDMIHGYNCPGALAVRRDEPAGEYDDWRIDQAWDHEMSFGGWNPQMVPFIDVSNGDFYCVGPGEPGVSPVWYHYHDDDSQERLADSFDEFLGRLEWHLNATE